MPEIDPIDSTHAMHRPVVHREHCRVATPERHDFGSRLHARPLFGQHKLAAGEVLPRLRQQNHHLQREDVFTINDVARRKMKTKAFARSRDERKRIEMRFAHLNTHHGFERMGLRGLSGARDEFHLAAIVQNLTTLAPRIPGPPPERTCTVRIGSLSSPQMSGGRSFRKIDVVGAACA